MGEVVKLTDPMTDPHIDPINKVANCDFRAVSPSCDVLCLVKTFPPFMSTAYCQVWDDS